MKIRILFVSMLFVFTSLSVHAQREVLNKLVASYTEQLKKLDAYNAPYFNLEEDLDKFGDYLSPEFREKHKKLVIETLKELKKVDLKQLNQSYQITYDLLKEDLETALESYQFPLDAMTVDNKGMRLIAYLEDSSPSLSLFPFSTVKHYDAFVARAAGFPAFIERQIKALQNDLKNKIVLSCPIAKKVPATYQDGLIKDVEKNPFFRPISILPKEFSKSDKEKITANFKHMVATYIVPSFEKFDSYFQKEYLPKCRQDFGYGTLPNGKKWYRYFIKVNTNTNKSPEEI
ncbi:MAG: DUF885 family protein, partial [Bdellovibrionaceae bacterium]|nr:DUF885 family protein [Pseudobdellovibrionaceae bacterium]